MPSTSPKAGYTLLPRSSEDHQRKAQNVDTSKNANSFGLPVSALLRIIATIFSIIAISTLIAGNCFYLRYRAVVAFPLTFLCASTLIHVLAAIHSTFTSLVHVEWKGSNWPGPSQRSHGHPQLTRKPPGWLIRVVDLAVGTLTAVGITVSSLQTRWHGPIEIAGIVFTSLTAATHLILGFIDTEGYALTLSYSRSSGGPTQEQVRNPLTYHDLEDPNEQQTTMSTMDV